MFTELCLGTVERPLIFFELAFTPRFELITNLFPIMAGCSHHGVAMVGAAIHRMKMPSTNPTVPEYCFLNDCPLHFVENDRFLDHLISTPIRQQWLRNLFPLVPLRPTSFITG